MMDQQEVRHLSDKATKVLLNRPQTGPSSKGGWLMIATILIEAWDLYSIAFLLIFIKEEFHPSSWQLGFVAGAVQGGALVGAIFGGYIADKFGRRKVFLATMALFIVLALAQAFVWSIGSLIAIRFLIGLPLGSDIANGYAYIMESMSKGKREVMGSRWQFMFGLGEVICILIVTAMYATGMGHGNLWRIGLAMGAVPAIALLLARLDLPETPLSLIQRGRFIEAKEVSLRLFNEPLDMLPAENVQIEKPKTGDFLKVIWADPIKRRGSIFGWISNACQGAEFAAWGFYLPVILSVAGVGVSASGGLVGTNLVTAGIFCLATVSGFVAPMLLPKIGHRGVSMWGFGLAFVGLILGAFALQNQWKVLIVVSACVLMWGHYWDASNGMTICSLVAPARFKATASGFGYIFVKAASFFGAFAFPVLSGAWGTFGATLTVSLLSLTGFLSAKFILPELYGHVETEDTAVRALAGQVA